MKGHSQAQRRQLDARFGGGGGQQGSWLEREKEGSAGGRGRGTLYLSPSQRAGHPCWAGHPWVWMPGEVCNPLCAHTEDSGLLNFHQVRC